MKRYVLVFLVCLLAPCAGSAEVRPPVIFASFAEDGTQLHHALILVESIRTFGGEFKDAPIWVCVPERLLQTNKEMLKKFAALKAEIKTSTAPGESRDLPFARKVFAAAESEAEATGKASILVWMDEDTVVLKEPRECIFPKGKSFGYRPVMHQNIGSPYAEAPDAFWRRVYEKLSVPQSAMFPMRTVAEGKVLRPYFNAGLLVVRPERGILRKWAEDFTKLYRDPIIAGLCRQDRPKKIFLHQAALAGAILNLLKKNEMTRLSGLYNYPIFFKEMYGADKEFDSLDRIVTLRYDVYFQNPAPNWSEKLKGPAAIVSWLEERLGSGQTNKGAAATKLRYRFQQGGGSSR